jgi:Transposase DDE domain
LHAALVERPGSCIRRLAGTRAREMQFTRFLRNPAVTAAEIAGEAAKATAARVAGCDVVVIQDTSELALGGRRKKLQGYGPVGKGGALRGLLLHAVVAADAANGGVIGLIEAKVSNRTGGKKVASRRARKTDEKESQRWIDGTIRAAEVVAEAASITGVSDRESDIYEHFARRPATMHLIVRACQNRKVITPEKRPSSSLYPYMDSLPEHGRFLTTIPAAPGRKARVAEIALRFSRIKLCKPRNGAACGLPASIELTVVDVRETSKPADGDPVHWRLITTYAVADLDQARRIVDLYRMRWIIEEYFHTLKTAGFDIEAADIGDPKVMMNLVAAAAVAAVTVMQLVKARDGTTGQNLTEAFDPADQPILEAASAKLEGKTAKQKNPHPSGSLAFASWVVGRLGGWTGYYGKPGPQVMRRGLEAFQRIKYGVHLGLQNV